jgi:hypothetical protein
MRQGIRFGSADYDAVGAFIVRGPLFELLLRK